MPYGISCWSSMVQVMAWHQAITWNQCWVVNNEALKNISEWIFGENVMDLNHKIQLKTVLLIKSDTIVSKDMPLVSYHWMYISLHYPISISRPDNGHLKSAVCYLSMQDQFSKTVHVFGEILWRNADTAFKMNIFLSVLLSDPVVMICDTVPIVQCYLIGKIMRPFFNSVLNQRY